MTGDEALRERHAGSEEPLVRALELAHRRLARRESTVAEMRRHLVGRDLDEAVVETALAHLLEHGLLDDARYARLYVEDRRRLDGWGSERIRRSLRERGLDGAVIDHALAQSEGAMQQDAFGEEPDGAGGELSRALAVLRRRFPAGVVEPREQARAFGVLVRKGYASELAADAVSAFRSPPQGERRRRSIEGF